MSLKTELQNSNDRVPVASIQQVDFRRFLQEELVQRIQKNSRYSLRSFARLLGIHPGTLSQILNNKRPLTKNAKEKIARKLGYSPEVFWKLEALETPTANSTHDLKFRQLTLDAFQVIA